MARISIKSSGGAQSWEIEDQPLSVGRRPENRIIVNDGYASGRHAAIGRDPAGYYVEDLKSSNGTQLNGAPISRSPLRHGDVIRIGTVELLFEDPSAQMEATMIMSAPLTPKLPPAAVRPAPAAPATAPPPPRPAAPAAPTASPSVMPRPVAPPPAPTAPPAMEVPRLPPQPTAPPRPAPAASNTSSMLDELVGSIRSHRDREQQEREEAAQRIRGEWEKLLGLAEELKAKTGSDPRVKRFIIDRRAGDVMIQLQRNPTAQMLFIMVSLQHPDQKSHTLSGLWLRRTNEPDRCMPTAQQVGTELIRDLAFLLA